MPYDLFFVYCYFIDFVAFLYFVNNLHSFKDFAKAGMLPVEMLCIGSAMADKELGTPGISAGMGHQKHTP
jgi:hypothetical protein